MLARALLVLSLAPSLALAQAQSRSQSQSPAPSATSQARMLWKDVAAYLVESANDMPENLYSFKPTPAVRTFAELLGHVAGSQKMFCAMALGEKPPSEDEVERTATTKAALIAALTESNTYCERAYAQTDAATRGMVDVFGQQRTKLYALMMNATHDNEHYGNVVTYLRINNMVPPSSKPRR